MDQKNEQIKGMTEYTDKMQEIFYDDEETIFADSIKPYDITIEVNHKNTIDKNKEKIRRLAMYLSKLQKLAHDNGATPDQATAADVEELCHQVAEKVKEQSGVDLEMEIKRLG